MEFNEACARVRQGDIRPGGIGILQEKPLHATLKWWLDENPDGINRVIFNVFRDKDREIYEQLLR